MNIIVINEQCTYTCELGNHVAHRRDNISNAANKSALHLQICATETLASLLP